MILKYAALTVVLLDVTYAENCIKPEATTGMKIDGNDQTTEDGEITFSCDTGFYMTISDSIQNDGTTHKRTCNAGGLWSDSDVIECNGEPEKLIRNGQIEYGNFNVSEYCIKPEATTGMQIDGNDQTTEDGEITFSCDTGFYMTISDRIQNDGTTHKRTCNAGGVWSDSDVIECNSKLEKLIRNGHNECGNVNVSEYCIKPEETTGMKIDGNDQTTEDGEITFSCDTGFYMTISDSIQNDGTTHKRTCNAAGVWSDSDVIKCNGEPEKLIRNGQIEYGNFNVSEYCIKPETTTGMKIDGSEQTTEDGEITFSCDTGFYMTISDSIQNDGTTHKRTCNAAGVWSDSDVIECNEYCIKPAETTGMEISGSDQTPEDGEITFSCDTGFYMTISDSIQNDGTTHKRTCNAGGLWSDSDVIECNGEPEKLIRNGQIEYGNFNVSEYCIKPETTTGMKIDGSEQTTEDGEITFSCDTGFYMTISDRIQNDGTTHKRTCNAGGVWSDSDVIKCNGEPEKLIRNGQIEYGNFNVSEYCIKPAETTGMEISGSDQTPEDGEITFSCDTGYYMTISDSIQNDGTTHKRTCNAGGVWSNSDVIKCNGEPEKLIRNGQIEYGNFNVSEYCIKPEETTGMKILGSESDQMTNGGKITFSCNTGYYMTISTIAQDDGTTHIQTCEAGGVWSDSAEIKCIGERQKTIEWTIIWDGVPSPVDEIMMPYCVDEGIVNPQCVSSFSFEYRMGESGPWNEADEIPFNGADGRHEATLSLVLSESQPDIWYRIILLEQNNKVIAITKPELIV